MVVDLKLLPLHHDVGRPSPKPMGRVGTIVPKWEGLDSHVNPDCARWQPATPLRRARIDTQAPYQLPSPRPLPLPRVDPDRPAQRAGSSGAAAPSTPRAPVIGRDRIVHTVGFAVFNDALRPDLEIERALREKLFDEQPISSNPSGVPQGL
jgi:hypothetical protein